MTGTFLVTVRWHPPNEQPTCTASWMVNAIRGDCFTLILDDLAGLEVRIPLAYIEHVEIHRKG